MGSQQRQYDLSVSLKHQPGEGGRVKSIARLNQSGNKKIPTHPLNVTLMLRRLGGGGSRIYSWCSFLYSHTSDLKKKTNLHALAFCEGLAIAKRADALTALTQPRIKIRLVFEGLPGSRLDDSPIRRSFWKSGQDAAYGKL